MRSCPICGEPVEGILTYCPGECQREAVKRNQRRYYHANKHKPRPIKAEDGSSTINCLFCPALSLCRPRVMELVELPCQRHTAAQIRRAAAAGELEQMFYVMEVEV